MRHKVQYNHQFHIGNNKKLFIFPFEQNEPRWKLSINFLRNQKLSVVDDNIILQRHINQAGIVRGILISRTKNHCYEAKLKKKSTKFIDWRFSLKK